MTTIPKEDIQKAIAWIDEHWKGQKTCPLCANTRWGVADLVGEVQMTTLTGDLTGQAYPLVIVTCQTCGYTLLLNALVIGLIEGRE